MRFISRWTLVLSAALALSCTGPASIEADSSRAPTSSVHLFVQPGAHLAPILSLIREARTSIRLEIYLLTDRTLIRELARAHQRGIDVRVLLEQRPYGGSRSARTAYAALRSAGVSVRWANERAFTFMHEKAMVLDGRVAGIFTMNLTSSGIFRNREFGVVDEDPSDARSVAAIFDADWSRQRPHISNPRLAVSPYNSRHDFDQLIDRARHTLDLYAEEVNDDSVESHLTSAARRGVRVRLITSSRSAGTDLLDRSGVAVHLLKRPYVHAKAIVSDGASLFVGSENISTTSLDRNRELGIVLTDRALAATVERTFQEDWSAGSGRSGPAPTAAPQSGVLKVRVSADPSTVRPGRSMIITGHTSQGARCAVRVTYPDGYVSRSRSLSTEKVADESGSVSWSWRVGSKVPGRGHATVTCTLEGRSARGSASFQISG